MELMRREFGMEIRISGVTLHHVGKYMMCTFCGNKYGRTTTGTRTITFPPSRDKWVAGWVGE